MGFKPKPPRVVYQEMHGGGSWFLIELDCDNFTLRFERNGQEVERIAAADLADLARVYGMLHDRLVDELGDPDDLMTLANATAERLDLGAELERLARRERQRLEHGPRSLERIERINREVAAILGAADLSNPALAEVAAKKSGDVSAEGLIASFEYVIDLGRSSGEPAAPGGCKIGGLPHMPPSLAWPTDQPWFFYAQLSCAQLAACDPFDAIPARGFLYYFISETAGGRLLYADCDGSALAVVARPASLAVPSYMRFLDEPERLELRSNWLFNQGSDIYTSSMIGRELPAEVRRRLDDAVGNTSGQLAAGIGGDRIWGGEPVDWQSEGCFIEDELFAQFECFDGNLMIGIDTGDLRAGYTADAQCTYRGT